MPDFEECNCWHSVEERVCHLRLCLHSFLLSWRRVARFVLFSILSEMRSLLFLGIALSIAVVVVVVDQTKNVSG